MNQSALHNWMFDMALPVWLSIGVDRKIGGPVEALILDGTERAALDFKRARVTCRRVYVFHMHNC